MWHLIARSVCLHIGLVGGTIEACFKWIPRSDKIEIDSGIEKAYLACLQFNAIVLWVKVFILHPLTMLVSDGDW